MQTPVEQMSYAECVAELKASAFKMAYYWQQTYVFKSGCEWVGRADRGHCQVRVSTLTTRIQAARALLAAVRVLEGE